MKNKIILSAISVLIIGCYPFGNRLQETSLEEIYKFSNLISINPNVKNLYINKIIEEKTYSLDSNQNIISDVAIYTYKQLDTLNKNNIIHEETYLYLDKFDTNENNGYAFYLSTFPIVKYTKGYETKFFNKKEIYADIIKSVAIGKWKRNADNIELFLSKGKKEFSIYGVVKNNSLKIELSSITHPKPQKKTDQSLSIDLKDIFDLGNSNNIIFINDSTRSTIIKSNNINDLKETSDYSVKIKKIHFNYSEEKPAFIIELNNNKNYQFDNRKQCLSVRVK